MRSIALLLLPALAFAAPKKSCDRQLVAHLEDGNAVAVPTAESQYAEALERLGFVVPGKAVNWRALADFLWKLPPPLDAEKKDLLLLALSADDDDWVRRSAMARLEADPDIRSFPILSKIALNEPEGDRSPHSGTEVEEALKALACVGMKYEKIRPQVLELLERLSRTAMFSLNETYSRPNDYIRREARRLWEILTGVRPKLSAQQQGYLKLLAKFQLPVDAATPAGISASQQRTGFLENLPGKLTPDQADLVLWAITEDPSSSVRHAAIRFIEVKHLDERAFEAILDIALNSPAGPPLERLSYRGSLEVDGAVRVLGAFGRRKPKLRARVLEILQLIVEKPELTDLQGHELEEVRSRPTAHWLLRELTERPRPSCDGDLCES